MREIKFRVWDKEDKQMYYFDQCTMMNYLFTFRELVAGKDLKEWLQYIGLKDKNGKEIYEGDILKYGEAHWEKRSAVEFGDHMASGDFYASQAYGFYIKHVNTSPYDDNQAINDHTLEHIQVLGNIYENPELLQK